jgi:predicted ATPase
MELAIEAIVPRDIKDQWGDSASLSETHLRYELKLVVGTVHDRPRIRIAHELLRGLRRVESENRLRFHPTSRFLKRFVARGSRQQPYIDTEGARLVLHQDGRQGRKREYRAEDSVSTVLSAANTVTFRHAFALRQELSRIRFLQLEPERLRAPSKIAPFETGAAARLDSFGGNLPAVLARLASFDPAYLGAVARDLRAVVRDLKSVDIWEDKVQKQLVARATFDHGGPFPASLLSDGTLRLMALAALKHDPEHQGVLCFEEPENGIHPQRMTGLLGILEGLTTDATGDERGRDVDEPLRQLLVNTHSPALVSAVDRRDLLFAVTYRHFEPELKAALLASRFLPVLDELPLRQKGEIPSSITRTEVVRYLASVDIARWQDERTDDGDTTRHAPL